METNAQGGWKPPYDVEALEALEAEQQRQWEAHQRGEPGAGMRYARCVDLLCNLRDEAQRYGTLHGETDDGELMFYGLLAPDVTDEERAALGVPALAVIQADMAAENRRRAEARAAEPGLPDDLEFVRVWRPWTPEALQARWDREGQPIWADGDELTMVWRSQAEALHTGWGINMPMWRLDGSDLWILTVRVRDLEQAVITYVAYPKLGTEGWIDPEGETVWRGPLAPPALERASGLAGTLMHHTLDSIHLGEGRELTVYLPPGHDRDAHVPVVYLADGTFAEGFAQVVEPLVAAGSLPPCVLVGVHNVPVCDIRSAEYLAGWDPERFEAHRRFFVEEVSAWAQEHLAVTPDRDRCAVAGASSGAAFAATMGIQHPERYGHVFAFSLGVPPAEDPIWPAGHAPRHYLAAGTLESDFRRETARYAATLQRLGVDHVYRERVGGHDSALWEEEFVRALGWAFSP